MEYTVVAADAESITVWDGKTKDSKHPGKRAGEMTLLIGDHPYQIDDTVALTVHLVNKPQSQKDIQTNDQENKEAQQGHSDPNRGRAEARKGRLTDFEASQLHHERNSGGAVRK